ncbi:competence/damage-inducible protein A [Phycicoccus sp. CSK15P-2]|uniref:competence/damage-inducible protein A n=1 Tax=Phycicoccus sp. CSK15P-2 TaxID=2807627 RepID=UPI00194F670A|nr:competence/damage-inducible protein A [Phycicoccus sp. CSK15P-2]MBM6405771.1 competence/damage-inducible protein A [Phycicoccus sp. CSK15P-2]
MGARASVVVTGTEVLTGRVLDRNGPWLAEALRRHGVDIGEVVVVGDRPDDLTTALHHLLDATNDLVITTGGLGPTADDLTAQVVADVQRRTMHLDQDLEQRIAAVIARLVAAHGWSVDAADLAAATRKQAMVPEGAAVLEPVGTAPGLVVTAPDGATTPPVLVLPGPPRELQGMWDAALATEPVRHALAGRTELHEHTMRLWGTAESELAASLRRHAAVADLLEVTTCLRDGELEVVVRSSPAESPTVDALRDALITDFGAAMYSPHGATIDAVVAELLLSQGSTIATAESCTAGLVAGRLADRPGSSGYLLGGCVTYSNEAKASLLGVSAGLVERMGAVSEEVARAMADGVRARTGADIGVSVTGVAGPTGGTPEKPVGLVHLCATGPAGSKHRRVVIGGGRNTVRRRSVVEALHLVRALLG